MHKCLNINFSGFIFEVSGFIFEVGIYFEVFVAVFVAVLHELFERNDITKLSTVEQHCNHRCSVMLTVIPEITCSFRNSQSILALRASKINFNKTVCLLMALTIDSVVPGRRIYKDAWSVGMDSE